MKAWSGVDLSSPRNRAHLSHPALGVWSPIPPGAALVHPLCQGFLTEKPLTGCSESCLSRPPSGFWETNTPLSTWVGTAFAQTGDSSLLLEPMSGPCSCLQTRTGEGRGVLEAAWLTGCRAKGGRKAERWRRGWVLEPDVLNPPPHHLLVVCS